MNSLTFINQFRLLLFTRIRWVFTGCLYFLCLHTVAQQVPDPPRPPRLVNDLAHLLLPEQADALEQKLKDYNDSTSTQIAIVTVPTTGDVDIADYALAIGRKWGVGGKQFNNGVVLLVAKEDRKVWIATGYGMEGVLPDAICKRIIENEIKPHFKEGQYYQGLNAAVAAMIAAAAGEYQASGKGGTSGGKGMLATIFLVLIILFILSRIGGGGGGGSLISRHGFGVWGPPIIGGSVGGWSGGSGGETGFGGFGGGSFGGGGAGGSW